MVAADATTTTTTITTAQHKDLCTMNQQCLNGGKCVDANESVAYKHCECAEGYSGPHCSRHCPLQCQNGGYCTFNPRGGARGDQDQNPSHRPSEFICKCHGYFMGTLCEVPYTNCGNQVQCLNGGTCVTNSEDGSHSCQCPEEYTGEVCETPLPKEEEAVLTSSESMELAGPMGMTAVGTSSVRILLCFVLLVGGVLSGYFIGRRKGWTWRRKENTNYNEDEEALMMQAGVRRINFKEPASVRYWSSSSRNGGVELNLI
jgi:hypothetical protein